MTRVLLDTHVALWLAAAPERVPAALLAIASDASTDLLFSAASAWEISIKSANGKLALPRAADDFVTELTRELALQELPISIDHAARAGALPPIHRDPFDRMLVAQAQALGVAIMTVDPKIAAYDVSVLA
jgi:PIN domain nuclease of toxin-antitoxin system